MKLEKLTKLPEDVLEAVLTDCPADQKQSNSKSKSSKPAAVDIETEDARLADDESELKILFFTSAKFVYKRFCVKYCLFLTCYDQLCIDI